MAEKEQKTKATPVSEYTKEELLKHAEKLFEQPRHVVAGALHKVEKSTVAEAKKKVAAFLKKAVK